MRKLMIGSGLGLVAAAAPLQAFAMPLAAEPEGVTAAGTVSLFQAGGFQIVPQGATQADTIAGSTYSKFDQKSQGQSKVESKMQNQFKLESKMQNQHKLDSKIQNKAQVKMEGGELPGTSQNGTSSTGLADGLAIEGVAVRVDRADR